MVGILSWWKADCADGRNTVLMVGRTTAVISIARCLTDNRDHSALYKINTNVYTYKHCIPHTTPSHTSTLFSFLFCFFAQFCFWYLSAYGFHRTNSNKDSILVYTKLYSFIVIISSTNKSRKHKSSMLIWVLPIYKMIINNTIIRKW